jgi:hypothetical protein
MDKTNKIDTNDLLKRLEKGVDIWNLSDFHSDLKHAYEYAIEILHPMSEEDFIKFIMWNVPLKFQMLNNRVYDKFDDEVFASMTHSELVKYIKWQFYNKIKKLQAAAYRLEGIIRDNGKHAGVRNWCITLGIVNDDDQLVPQEEANFDDLVKEIELFIKQCQKETERYEKYEELVCDLRDMMEDNDLETGNVDDMNTTALNVIDQLEKQLAEVKKVVKEHLDDKMRI